MDLDRRRFLGLAGAALLLDGVLVACTPGGDVPQGVEALVEGFLSDPDGAARLGDSLAVDDLAAAAALLAPATAEPDAWFATATPATFAAHVRAAVAADHAAGRVVEVSGWWLTPTEAALCQVAAAGRTGSS